MKTYPSNSTRERAKSGDKISDGRINVMLTSGFTLTGGTAANITAY
jgi:hypothetical protein